MVFSSILFLLYFLPVVLAVNYALPSRYRNYWLLLASFLFYAWGAPSFTPFLIASVVLNFLIVKRLDRSRSRSSRKKLLGFSIVLNLGLLAYFKYANFFVENVENLSETDFNWQSVALPIGISFFTFQSITYSVDVYRKVQSPLNKWADYALYILLFPQMIAGPIVRYGTIAKELLHRKLAHETFRQGVFTFMIGLGKKVLIANVLSEFASSELLAKGMLHSSTDAWLGILAYTFQIYFDFSGYSDMAIGLGLMLGFHFPENFNNPYTSKSITEFWRKWHITLGSFMRDYLYIPLGGNRVSSTFRLYANLLIVFALSGLWHGASWNFVIWGLYHGFFLVVERLFLSKLLTKIPATLQVVYSFIVVLLGWVFFSVEQWSDAISYFQSLFSFNFAESELFGKTKFMSTLVVSVFFSFWVLLPKGLLVQSWWYENRVKLLWLKILVTLLIFIWAIASLVASGHNPFIYYRF